MKYATRILVLVMMMTPLLAAAQLGNSAKVVTKVPFDFMAGEKLFPAGQCIVMSAGNGGTQIMIRNASAKISQYSLVLSSDDQKGPAVNALIFHKYGNRYFLTGLKDASTHATYKLPETTAEAELRAQNIPATEEILLAASNQ
jgi:hypothetical protein